MVRSVYVCPCRTLTIVFLQMSRIKFHISNPLRFSENKSRISLYTHKVVSSIIYTGIEEITFPWLNPLLNTPETVVGTRIDPMYRISSWGLFKTTPKSSGIPMIYTPHYSYEKMSHEKFFFKIFILRNNFIDSHSYLPRHIQNH